MGRRLPSLAGLRAFEAAGRLGSVSRAAEELSVTQSAVSHQIRRLETELGVRLLIRQARSVAPTDAGRQLLDSLSPALDAVSAAAEAIRAPARHAARARLRVSLLASFASNWLVPRLGRFAAAHPNIELRLEPAIERVDPVPGGVDLSIRYGRGGWPGVTAQLIFSERIAPVAAPVLLAARPVTRVEDLRRHQLLLSYSPQAIEWSSWAEATGTDISEAARLMLHDYNIVIEAALAGQGVAMGRLRLLADRLAGGQLIRLTPPVALAGLGYWLVLPLTAPSAPRHWAVGAFIDWIESETTADPAIP